MDAAGIVTLRYVVANYRNDFAYDERDDERLMQWAIDAYMEMSMRNHTKHFKMEWLTVSAIKTVELPFDFIDYLAVGIPADGQLLTFTRERSIIKTRSESCGAETMDAERGEGVDIDDYVGFHHYTIPMNNPDGYFDIDYQQRRIFLQNVTATEVLLVYKSTGINLDGETYIPRQAVNAVKAYMQWRMSEKNNHPMNDRNVNESRWEYEKKMLSRQMSGFTMDEVMDLITKGYSQGAKR